MHYWYSEDLVLYWYYYFSIMLKVYFYYLWPNQTDSNVFYLFDICQIHLYWVYLLVQFVIKIGRWHPTTRSSSTADYHQVPIIQLYKICILHLYFITPNYNNLYYNHVYGKLIRLLDDCLLHVCTIKTLKIIVVLVLVSITNSNGGQMVVKFPISNQANGTLFNI